jgi:UDP-glucose 4,6-dehydratase
MPLSSDNSDRNFISKITKYEKICSIKNSMTVLDDMLPLCISMMKNNEKGTYNFTNPGSISHNEILELYREIVDPDFKWTNFDITDQDKILKSKRSNNFLDTTKLTNKYSVKNIKEATIDVLHKMKV